MVGLVVSMFLIAGCATQGDSDAADECTSKYTADCRCPNHRGGNAATAATTAPAAAGGKTLTIAMTGDPGTADPQLTTEYYMLPLNIFDRLVEAQTTAPGKSEIVPGLAGKVGRLG